MQFAYYLFLLGDYKAAVKVLEDTLEYYPDDAEVSANLVVTLSKAGDYQKSVAASIHALSLDDKSYMVYDALAHSYAKLGRYDEATEAGDRSLGLKDLLPKEFEADWRLPADSIKALTASKKRVIAFSLWGDKEDYINGAVRNLLLACDLYPDWEIWIYHDSSVPKNTLELLSRLGATLLSQADQQSEKHKLCWRFQVADHPEVGYFLVRDIDSVFSLRERLAVQEWLDSEQWFHTINDWWTHTDLMLAGLWGGVAAVLPNVRQAVIDYTPAALSTPHIDQWFLRDKIWPYVKQSCLIHDRCYRQEEARPLPGPPPLGNQHIGSCEFKQQPERQRHLIQPWLNYCELSKPT